MTRLLKRVPGTAGARGLPWAVAVTASWLDRLLVQGDGMEGGRDGLGFLPGTSSRKRGGEKEESGGTELLGGSRVS